MKSRFMMTFYLVCGSPLFGLPASAESLPKEAVSPVARHGGGGGLRKVGLSPHRDHGRRVRSR